MLPDLLKEAFLEAFSHLPKNAYEANKLLKQLGIGYKKLDACPNDCIIYWRDKDTWKKFKTCKQSRWQLIEKDLTGEKRKIPLKSYGIFC